MMVSGLPLAQLASFVPSVFTFLVLLVLLGLFDSQKGNPLLKGGRCICTLPKMLLTPPPLSIANLNVEKNASNSLGFIPGKIILCPSRSTWLVSPAFAQISSILAMKVVLLS